MKKYALYPGCSALGGEKELLESVLAISPALDLEFTILTEATCCGGAHLEERDKTLALMVHALIFAQAEKLGLPLITLCNTCQLVLRESWHQMKNDASLLLQINTLLHSEGFTLALTHEVKHILTLFTESDRLALIRKKTVRSLTDMKIGCYYGCHLLRTSSAPQEYDLQNPAMLESVVTACGATPILFPEHSLCCGFHVFIHSPQLSDTLVTKIMLGAVQSGVHFLVTPCPLCQMSLDATESKRKHKKIFPPLASLHVSQLIGWALGLPKKALGLQRNLVPFHSHRE